MSRLSATGVAVVLTIAAHAAFAACEWHTIAPGRGRFTMGTHAVDLGEADRVVSPTAWQGPIVISQAGSTCTVDPSVGIIERPLFSTATKMLVSTYSGSNKTVFIIDSANCNIAWKSKAFDGPVSLHNGRLGLGATTLRLKKSCLP